MLTWTRVSAGHYDSDNSEWRIDTCTNNKRRFDVYEFDGEGYEMVACCTTLAEAKALVAMYVAPGIANLHVTAL